VKKLAASQPVARNSGGDLYAAISLNLTAPSLLFALRKRRSLLLAAMVFATPALAYKRSVNSGGMCVWWSTRGHSFMIDARGTPDVEAFLTFSAVRNSFATWAAISCSDLSFPDEGISQDSKDRVVGYFPGQHNANLVLWRTADCRAGIVPVGDPCLTRGGCGNKYDCWDHADGVIAITTTTSSNITGEIIDSDIELNDGSTADGGKLTFTAVDGPPCTSPTQTGCVRIDIQNTITHEAGHSLGLDHSLDPAATMYGLAAEGEISKRTLGADDIKAICDIYPKGAPTVTCVPAGVSNGGTAGASSNGGCSQAQAGSDAALGILLLLLQISRARRRSPGCR